MLRMSFLTMSPTLAPDVVIEVINKEGWSDLYEYNTRLSEPLQVLVPSPCPCPALALKRVSIEKASKYSEIHSSRGYLVVGQLVFTFSDHTDRTETSFQRLRGTPYQAVVVL